MVMTGNVSASGDVKIEMHTESDAGARPVQLELAGTLRVDRLDTTGSFCNGRSVTLSWRKD